MTMLAIFIGTQDTLQDSPTLHNTQHMQAGDANAKHCL